MSGDGMTTGKCLQDRRSQGRKETFERNWALPVVCQEKAIELMVGLNGLEFAGVGKHMSRKDMAQGKEGNGLNQRQTFA